MPIARAVVRRRMGGVLRAREESLDLLQSACRRAIERKARYVHRGEAEFQAWWLSIVENKIVDRFREQLALKRSHGREQELELEDLSPAATPGGCSASTPSGHAARNEDVDRVRRCIEALEPELRGALELHAFEGLSYERLSQRLDITPKQARLRVVKAKSMLARALRSA